MLPMQHAMLEEWERKLFTLLILRELGSCTFTQLLHFAVNNEIMTYVDLKLGLDDLTKNDLITSSPHPAEPLYAINDAGREMLTYFLNRLPYSKVEAIKMLAPTCRERFNQEKALSATIKRNVFGEYVAHLALMDGSDLMMKIELPVPEREIAERIAKNWPDKAAEIYSQLLNSLGEEHQDV